MHQHPRVPPAMASPARLPQMNPMRSNNSRDQPTHSRQSSESVAPSDQGIYITEGGHSGSASPNSPEGKLDLIIQNYFYKAALMILDARTPLTQAFTARENKPRVNRWFNTELPETDELFDHTRQWKRASALHNRPSPMIIETYIDLGDLASNQKLVIYDESGKRQDVEIALKEQLGGHISNDSQLRKFSILLERWTCELGPPWSGLDGNFPLNEVLPKTYKGSIVLYRSLFAHLKLMPAWKFYKKTSKPHPGQVMPRLRWRIYDLSQQQTQQSAVDELEVPLLSGNSRVTETMQWDPVDSPAGEFSIKVTYRHNCDFRIDTSESLFNSQFMASDEKWFEPSLPLSSLLGGQKSVTKPQAPGNGSLPRNVKDVSARQRLNEIAEQGPAYGSMSTFHNTGGRIGTSPLSALRAARELNARSPVGSPPWQSTGAQPAASGYSGNRRGPEAVASLSRRTSVSIQPFKMPTYSTSVPIEQAAMPPSSPRIAGTIRNSPLAALTEARNPGIPIHAPMSPQTSPKLAEALPVGSTTSSPRPTPSRYSSSFSHRRNRPSTGGASMKAEDDNVGSDRGSTSSSNVQSGLGHESNAASSSHADDENISEFLRMLDAKKELKSFRGTSSTPAGPPTSRGTTATLSKFNQLRDSHAALTDSLSSSQMMQRSSVSSASRQLANVPPMVAGTSTSIASSPGERISPRTPHTPAIPSRLSSNSIIEYNQAERAQRSRPLRFSESEDTSIAASEEAHRRQDASSTQEDPAQAAGAIPIPTSPRTYQSTFRRSSSAAAHRQSRERGSRNERYEMADDIGDILPFALRSASLGDGDEREPLSLSGLVRLQEATVAIPTGVPPPPPDLEDDGIVGVGALQPRAHSSISPRQQQRVSDDVTQNTALSSRASQPPIARGPRSFVRHSFSRPTNLTNFEDDEPLLFAMSEQLEGNETAR